MKLSDLVIKEAYQGVRPRWARPILNDEKGEMIQMANNLRLPWNTIQQAFLKAELVTLERSIWSAMQNTDSTRNISMAEIRTWEDSKDVDGILEALKTGKDLAAPMVLIHEGVPHCVAGNTRLSIAKVLGIVPKVLLATTGRSESRVASSLSPQKQRVL
jgi:hypothetical protein